MLKIGTSLIAGAMIAAIGCSVATEDTASSSAAAITEAGEFQLIVVPPAQALDWSTPNALAQSAVVSEAFAKVQKWTGVVTHPHPVGHVHVRMDCGDVTIPLTGQTGAGSDFTGALDGLGSMFHTFPGALDSTADVEPDVRRRFETGNVTMMTFKITMDQCRHLRGFFDEYVNSGAVKNYGGQYRPRRMEGGGCTAFGTSFLEVGGLLKRSQYTPVWARGLKIGIGRISDVFGSGEYNYGSYLTTRNADGTVSAWPEGKAMKVQSGAIRIGSPWLDAWSGDNDAETNVDPENQPNVVPVTLHDPQLMANSIEEIYARGGGEALGRTWTTKAVGMAHVLETDATGATVQPYRDMQDDLYKD